MNYLKAIVLTLISSVMFAAMSALVRYAGQDVPVGQVVFFRAACAIPPVLLIYALRGELRLALHTKRPFGHLGRGMFSIGGMFCNFAALARLPVVDATAFSFSSPLITVVFSVIFLKEKVRLYRWTAVIIGFIGVIVMLWPHLDPKHYAGAALGASALGALLAIVAAIFNSGSIIQTRRLTGSESTSAIVFYFSLICALAGLATWPLGWHMPDMKQLAALIGTGILGGLAHILLTDSYRHAPASLVAPFGYSAMLWAFVFGWFFFDEIPVPLVFAGAAIVAGAGLFVFFRERKLGLRRPHEVEGQGGAG
jgi:drug/metabolite transporter (DMT)-like permease